MIKSYLVDENGTVLEEFEHDTVVVPLNPGDRVLRKGTINYLQDTTDIKYHFI